MTILWLFESLSSVLLLAAVKWTEWAVLSRAVTLLPCQHFHLFVWNLKYGLKRSTKPPKKSISFRLSSITGFRWRRNEKQDCCKTPRWRLDMYSLSVVIQCSRGRRCTQRDNTSFCAFRLVFMQSGQQDWHFHLKIDLTVWDHSRLPARPAEPKLWSFSRCCSCAAITLAECPD